MECWSFFQQTKIPMGSFQVYDALSIFFKFEKRPIEHLEGFILLLREGGELHKFFKNFNQNSKDSPTGSAKVDTSMVGGMFAVVATSY